MKITRSRSRRVNDGNYGYVEFFCSVTLDHQDLGYSDEEWLDLVKEKGTRYCIDAITDKVTEEMEEAVSEEAAAALDMLSKYSTAD